MNLIMQKCIVCNESVLCREYCKEEDMVCAHHSDEEINDALSQNNTQQEVNHCGQVESIDTKTSAENTHDAKSQSSEVKKNE
jgi:hypothetical protein